VCLVYLDDIIVFLRCDGCTRQRIRLLFAMFAAFGLHVNRKKSDFKPRTVREHLGIIIDLTNQ
jgi:hypothetical protein